MIIFDGFFPKAECETLGSSKKASPCVFPFVYEGQLFDECTDVDSEIDFVWCATEVYDDNTVIDGEWAYCQLGCPGTSE